MDRLPAQLKKSSTEIERVLTRDSQEAPIATIVITTRGRREELRRALQSCREQRGVKLEVLVYDDASTDGTAEMVCGEFPEVRLIRSDRQVGYIVLRNQGFQDAVTPFVFSIDDDAWFIDPETVATVIRQFDVYPKAAAFALQYF